MNRGVGYVLDVLWLYEMKSEKVSPALNNHSQGHNDVEAEAIVS